jgi:hypothetical protein
MAAQARRMAEAAVVVRDIINGAAMLPRDAAAARIGGNGIHRMRLLFCKGVVTKPPQSNRCR